MSLNSSKGKDKNVKDNTPTPKADENMGQSMDTNKDDNDRNTILITQEPKIDDTNQKNDTEEKALAGEKDSMPEDVHNDTDHLEDYIADEVNGETNISGRLMFLNKAKLKADVT